MQGFSCSPKQSWAYKNRPARRSLNSFLGLAAAARRLFFRTGKHPSRFSGDNSARLCFNMGKQCYFRRRITYVPYFEICIGRWCFRAARRAVALGSARFGEVFGGGGQTRVRARPPQSSFQHHPPSSPSSPRPSLTRGLTVAKIKKGEPAGSPFSLQTRMWLSARRVT